MLFRMALDVTEADFQTAVLGRSEQLPVVVDFWAEWCGPCRVLGPVIERAVADTHGKVELAKVDVDSNQGLARSYGIRGIPAVKAFRHGVAVDEFVGALPQSAVEQFIARLLPSEADELVAAGDESSLRRALELEPSRADAAAALARMLLERGDTHGALEIVDPIRGDFVAEGLAARARLELSMDGDDGQLRLALDALARGDDEAALEHLMTALTESADEKRELVRKAMVGIFTDLGADHPLSREYRRRLAAVL
jgi:putative thioredoxin